MTQTTSRPRTAKPERRRELDVMGVVVVLGLIFFHTAMFFYYGPFYRKNEQLSMAAQILTGFGGVWGMPLMFLIAGSAIWYSLRKRTTVAFVRERLLRLFVPFIMGLLVLAPPLAYYRLKADPTYHEIFVQFYPRFFNVRFALDFPLFIKGAPPAEIFQTAHLWFLIHLFTCTLLLLPLWLHLRKPAGQRLVERLASFCARPRAIFLLALPIAVIEAALGTEMTGNWNRFTYVPFLIYGFLFAADARFGQTLRRHRKSALVMGTLTLLGWFAGYIALTQVVQVIPDSDYGLGSVLLRFLKGLSSWFWIVAIMGSAGRARQERRAPEASRDTHLDSRPQPLRRKPSLLDRVAAYTREAQLPFYILHYPPVVLIGFYVLQWETSILVKYMVIALSSLVTTLVLYDIGVKRTRLTRFLFGMRPRQKAPGEH